MIDLSQAASIAAVSIPLAGIIITVIKVRGMSPTARPPGEYRGDRQPNQPPQCQGHCIDHTAISDTLAELKVGQKENRAELVKKSDDLWDEVKVIQNDVKTLLRNGGGK
jgi:hypothetical protein